MDRYYIEIDSGKFEENGEVEIIAPPKPWQAVFDDILKVKEGSFGIHRTDRLCNFVRIVGGAHGSVAEYLIRQKDGRNGLIVTNRELAAATGVSLGAANALLQKLRNADCIRCRNGSLMLNPGVSHKGNRQREAYLLKLFECFESKSR